MNEDSKLMQFFFYAVIVLGTIVSILDLFIWRP